jgi:putative membrane protein
MKIVLAVAAACMLAGAPAAIAASSSIKTQAAESMTKVDTPTFIKTVPGANSFEIESSKLALDKASSDDVKTFAQQMVTDHTKAGEDFKAALQQVQTTSSVTAGEEMQPKQAQQLKELQAASGKDFEAKYIMMQVEAHKEAVALFAAYADNGDDPALREFAKKTLPTLKMHEKHIKEVQAAHQKS